MMRLLTLILSLNVWGTSKYQPGPVGLLYRDGCVDVGLQCACDMGSGHFEAGICSNRTSGLTTMTVCDCAPRRAHEDGCTVTGSSCEKDGRAGTCVAVTIQKKPQPRQTLHCGPKATASTPAPEAPIDVVCSHVGGRCLCNDIMAGECQDRRGVLSCVCGSRVAHDDGCRVKDKLCRGPDGAGKCMARSFLHQGHFERELYCSRPQPEHDNGCRKADTLCLCRDGHAGTCRPQRDAPWSLACHCHDQITHHDGCQVAGALCINKGPKGTRRSRGLCQARTEGERQVLHCAHTTAGRNDDDEDQAPMLTERERETDALWVADGCHPQYDGLDCLCAQRDAGVCNRRVDGRRACDCLPRARHIYDERVCSYRGEPCGEGGECRPQLLAERPGGRAVLRCSR